MSLINLGVTQAGQGRLTQAAATTTEAVTLLRGLADASPSVYGVDLARALTNFATDQSDLGQRHDALTTIEEAVKVHRGVGGREPGRV